LNNKLSSQQPVALSVFYIGKCNIEECPEIMSWFIYLNGKFYSGKTEDTKYSGSQISSGLNPINNSPHHIRMDTDQFLYLLKASAAKDTAVS